MSKNKNKIPNVENSIPSGFNGSIGQMPQPDIMPDAVSRKKKDKKKYN